MPISNYEPEFPAIQFFITRFFLGTESLFEQETKIPLPTMIPGDHIEIFDKAYTVEKRSFGFHEDAFITVYILMEKNIT